MKIGVIGLGYWGKKVAREYVALMKEGAVDEVHIYDVIEDNVSEFRKECPECITHRDLDEVLKSDIDGFHVCTPNSTHYEIAMNLMKHGKNVLLEKPMAMAYQEARKLALYAYNNEMVLAVGHIFRFSNAVRKVKKMYEKGEIGRLWYAQLKWSTLMPSPKERDVVYDLAPHPIDILNYITSLWPTSISAIGRAFRRANYEEIAYINMDFNGDFIAKTEVSWLYPGKIRNVSIMGDRKFVSLEAVKQQIKVFDMEKEEWFDIPVEANNTILDEARHFVKAINNRQTPINDGFNGSENIKVLEAAMQSMRENRVIELEW